METSSKVMAANMALDAEIAVVGLRGEVWLAERLSWGDESGGEGERAQQPRFRRRLIGDFELPSANIPMHVEIVTVNGETFVLAGVLRQTQRALKLWHLAKTANVTSRTSADDSHQNGCTPREIELEKPRDGKLRGFGCVMPLPNTLEADVESKTYKLRLGCGLGIGKAHIWDLEIDLAQHSANQRHIGSVMGRRNSISAMCFAARKLVTVAALDELIQVWSIVELYEQHDENSANESNGGSAASPQGFNASSKLGAVHSVEELAQLMPNDALARLRAEHANFNQVQAKSFAEELAALPPCAQRPLWLLAIPTGVDLEPEKKHGSKPTDEATVPISEFVNLVAGLGDYEGDLDAEWSPHGFGSQTVSSSRDRELSYQGNWVHGRREGQGQLRDESTGQVIYKGQWHCDRKHGDGHEIRRGEEYTGRFCKDRRHERQNGATLARKLARRLKKGRMQLHTNYLKATLGEHRRSEVQQRKQWSAQYREKQAHLDDLGRRLDSEQSAHQASQLQLNRLNGRDLKAMRLSELTSLQDAVEEALQNCRLAIEASSAGT
ncbi:Radial spoke head 10-like B [Hondaea fermentalgiana]|uniref:Radial spoke head 10-like B n=1 Tax=Hondaea fermentalgiana TaxID=2315210 RepID=A0A2R5G5N1_9STRA|nr:Radial spoke head 10-like B [Hondaea fermentalgiana]|eukprot:GBG26362.1 Radial spoke head 10-like B [Hondaea fermentalgiana]